ncbi:MAG: dicarboxylate/amino acid:cation symporter [Desulfobacterales bacterium]|nr:dicarboxylate/amino acid:cation symporter [Desulfobacterales bacterium]
MKALWKNLWFKILVAMVFGIAMGLLFSPSVTGILSEDVAFDLGKWIALPGGLFLALIKMVVIPLVGASIALGIASSSGESFLKKMAPRLVPYFVLTTVTATLIGSTLALTIKPGNYIDSKTIEHVMDGEPSAQAVVRDTDEKSHFSDKLLRVIPTNSIGSALDQDMLAIVILAIFTGCALVSIGPKAAKPMIDLAESVQGMSLKIVEWAMALAPVAVFGLLFDITIRVGFEAILGMSVYIATVLVGLFLLMCFYLLIVFFIGKRSVPGFLKAVREVQLLAFSTSSSAAVMPLSMETAEKKLQVSPAVSKFIVPLGATINMDGTALYQVCAAVFLSQVFGVELSFLGLIALIATTVGASIGTPSTPGVGIVVLATILVGIGVPPAGIALIIGVDRILDMTRTMINVTGDLTACVVMDRFVPEVEA